MGAGEDCYMVICPECLARALSGQNMEKFDVNTLALGQHNFWKNYTSMVNLNHLRRTAVDTVSEEEQIKLKRGHYHVSEKIKILVTEPIFDPMFLPLLINKVQQRSGV